MKHVRYISANSKKTFKSTDAFLDYMSEALGACCDCDGRGCTICIASDALREAASVIRMLLESE